MSDTQLLDQIKKKIGYIGINEPKINGPWVATDRVAKEILSLCKETAGKVIGEMEEDFTRKANDGSWTSETLRNELKAEQLKRLDELFK